MCSYQGSPCVRNVTRPLAVRARSVSRVISFTSATRASSDERSHGPCFVLRYLLTWAPDLGGKLTLAPIAQGRSLCGPGPWRRGCRRIQREPLDDLLLHPQFIDQEPDTVVPCKACA